ncbi:MAG: penicillin-binding protein 1A [Gemmatimonadaceae bacterium]
MTMATPRKSITRGRRGGFFSRHPALVRAFFILFTFGASLLTGLLYGGWALVCRGGQCPSVAVLEDYTPRQTSKLYAADGRFIAEIGLERRTLAKLDEIPKQVQDAFVVTEDKRFYEHAGIDWPRVGGAVLRDVRAGSFVEGFSTITMQLARNIFPERISREKTPTRKLKEGKVARQIEARYSKQKILELYLNQIYLGSGAHGVETAAQRYFGKSIKDVNLAEAAMLAGLPKAPERYNPRKFPERAIQRRNTVIELMRREGKISDADASLAKAYPLRLARKVESGNTAPYFVEWVRQTLDEHFGRQLYEQGLKVYTTLDVDMQEAAERALERQIRAIESGRYGDYKHQSYEQYVARTTSGDDERAGANSPYLQGSFVAIDPRNGAVRALVGGRDFDDSKFNRATQALRQPGSTFKPIVYATAIHNGRPPSYVLDDTALSVPQVGGTDWTPQNYDGKYLGRIPLRRSLYESRNVSTIRLGMELGEQSVIDMARLFGLSTPIPPYPSIHIGAADVYPIEMVSAYTTFATLGIRSAPTAIVRVENAKGEVLWEPTPARAQVLSPEEAWLMVDMMKDVVRRGTAAGSVGGRFRFPAAGKTGTTNEGADVWFVGYTSDLVAGVWMGMDRPQKIKGNAQGGQLAAPAWTAFMNEVYQRKSPPVDWPRPANIVQREIDGSTGMLANPYCPRSLVYNESFIAGTDPVQECNVHTPYGAYGPGYDTLRGPDTTGAGARNPYGPPISASPGVRVVPGQAPIPQPSQPPPPRDTTSPFYIPPASTPRDTARRPRPVDTVYVPPPPPSSPAPPPDSTSPPPARPPQ